MKLTKKFLLNQLKNQQDCLKLLDNEQQQIHQIFKHDTNNFIKFIKQAQQLTQNPLIKYQELLNKQLGLFPQKQILINCLQIESQYDVNVLKTIPNNIYNPLIHNVFNQLIKYDLEYKEATTILHFLHNKKLLKILLNTQWVQKVITQSKKGLYNSNLKNLALLCRVYSDISSHYLQEIAQSIKIQNQADQFSYITLYQYLSILKDQKLLDSLKQQIQLDKCNKQSLIQLMIGASQCKDNQYLQQIYHKLNNQNLNDRDLCLILMHTTNTGIYDKQKIQQLYESNELLKLPFTNKQLGELCTNLFNQYELNICKQINTSQIDQSNIINLYSIDQDNQLKLDDQIKEYLQQNQIDFPGMMRLVNYPQFQTILAEVIQKQQYENIAYHVKELASILLKLDPLIENVHELLNQAIKSIEQDSSNAQGLGNILYLSSKKQNNRNIQLSQKVISKILKDSDPIELINFTKALDNYNSLTTELSQQIAIQIEKKTNPKNQERVAKHIQKMPKHLQILYNQTRLI